jgi:hypothetical protein
LTNVTGHRINKEISKQEDITLHNVFKIIIINEMLSENVILCNLMAFKRLGKLEEDCTGNLREQ